MKNISRSELLLYSIILLLPTYLLRFHVGIISLNLLDILIVSSFIFTVIEHRKKLVRSYNGWWKYTISSFVIIGAIAVVVSPHTIAAVGLYKSYIILPLLIGIMILLTQPPLQRILYSLAIAALYISLIAVIQYFTGYGIPAPWNDRSGDFRITSVYEYPNALGLFLAPVLSMLIAWTIHIRKNLPYILPVIALGCFAILFSHSEGAIVAIGVATIFSLLFTKFRWLTLGVSLLGLMLAFAWQPTRDILLFQNVSGEVRLALWQGTFSLLQDRPLVGAGLAGFPEVYAQYKLDRHVELLLYPHNIWLDFWVTLGLPGLVWLIITVVSFFKRLWLLITPTKFVLMAGMVAMLVYGLVDVPYFKNDLAVLFWIIITMSSCVGNEKSPTGDLSRLGEKHQER